MTITFRFEELISTIDGATSFNSKAAPMGGWLSGHKQNQQEKE